MDKDPLVEDLVPTGAYHVPVDVRRDTRRFAFLLLPEFTLLAFSAALDPLRIANQLAQAPLYRWRVLSNDGAPVRSSSGIDVSAHGKLSEATTAEHLLVCSGNQHIGIATDETLSVLRKHARFGGGVGGICTGASTLARAGLLGNRRFTLHWENQPGFLEAFPDLTPSENRFETDGTLLTCGGGFAATEMMLALIRVDYGPDFALTVADMCLSGDVAQQQQFQRSSLSRAASSRNPGFVAVLKAMHDNIDEPLTLDDLSELAGLSRRQIERLCRTHLGVTPLTAYRNIRLDRARTLLAETDMSVGEIGAACGFDASSNFSQAFKKRFGHSPSMVPRFMKRG